MPCRQGANPKTALADPVIVSRAEDAFACVAARRSNAAELTRT
jgi:hypothetical protein